MVKGKHALKIEYMHTIKKGFAHCIKENVVNSNFS